MCAAHQSEQRKFSLYIITFIYMVFVHYVVLGQVTDEESLFLYYNNENATTYAVEDHNPPFLDEILDELLANSNLTSVCSDDMLCLFDYSQTGDSSVGLDTADFFSSSINNKESNCA